MLIAFPTAYIFKVFFYGMILQAFTGLDDFETCGAILAQHDWNLEVSHQLALLIMKITSAVSVCMFSVSA